MFSRDTEDIKLQAYAGVPTILDQTTKIKIYPLTIKEIISIGMSKYNSMVSILTLTSAKISQMIKDKTKENVDVKKIEPLDYLLQSSQYNDDFLLDLQEAFHTFIREDILLLPRY